MVLVWVYEYTNAIGIEYKRNVEFRGAVVFPKPLEFVRDRPGFAGADHEQQWAVKTRRHCRVKRAEMRYYPWGGQRYA